MLIISFIYTVKFDIPDQFVQIENLSKIEYIENKFNNPFQTSALLYQEFAYDPVYRVSLCTYFLIFTLYYICLLIVLFLII